MILPITKQYTSKVVVKCLTFNHADYILDTIKGFAMQETSFPFTCVVMDDASTDGEQNIIRDYLVNECDFENAEKLEIDEAVVYVARHKSNDNCIFAFYLLTQNLYGTGKKAPLFEYWEKDSKYIALCEGDDYWTDPLKLQRQVDFLENNTEYSLSTENGLWYDIRTGEKRPFSDEPERDVTFDEMLIQRRFPTASVIYRQSFLGELSKLKPPVFDTAVWCCLSKLGKVHYAPIVSSVYRRGDGVTEKDKIQWAYTIRSFNKSLYKNFDIPDYIKKIRNKDMSANIYLGAKTAYKKRMYIDAVKLALYGFELNPFFMIKKILKVE